MRTGRAIIIPAIIALGVAGASLAGTAMPATAAHPTNVQVQAQAPVSALQIYYHV